MTRFLLATDSVHTTASACDYLADRLREGDEVIVVSAVPPDADPRDGGDAANVAPVRLGALASVETELVEVEPAGAVLELADDWDADELVIGARGGEPGASPAVGSTATAILVAAERPVVVIPVTELA